MNRNKLIIASCLIIACGAIYWVFFRGHKDTQGAQKVVSPAFGSIQNVVSSTGNIQPQNRLEIKPPIGGRIEKILVVEGQSVKVGDTLAIMSSTERATLLDAARLQGPDSIKEWENVYKPTPLLAPIDAQVIVKTVNPGQTVTPSDAVIVLSDRLIVQAQVDETDVGKVKLGQKAIITLDAYPDIEAKGSVDHIYYESKIVNNVTIYAVDIVPDKTPDVFRSGMSANVQIVQQRNDHALLVPKEAVKKKQGKSFVFVKVDGDNKPVRQEIETGIADDVNVEIISGLSIDDKVIIYTQNKTTNNKKQKSSPFMPGGGGGRGGR